MIFALRHYFMLCRIPLSPLPCHADVSLIFAAPRYFERRFSIFRCRRYAFIFRRFDAAI